MKPPIDQIIFNPTANKQFFIYVYIIYTIVNNVYNVIIQTN